MNIATLMRATTAAALTLAGATLLLPEPARFWTGWSLVTLLIGTHLVRVTVLCAIWFAEGDRRFGLIGVTLITVIASGLLGSAFWLMR